ncbi:MAG: class I SAM-dependent methyltransferase [Solobacterium sp.]|nr:class I SAM-dependent methyltransferase [Solobacterium sp.]
MITADIGTDHAFLPVYLLQHGICEKAYACDIAEGPLQSALSNIRENCLEDSIHVIKCDGFDGVPADTECAVIAGMGVFTAIGILERGMARVADLKQVIVQVNRSTDKLRKWISDHHFRIDDEKTVYENGFDYEIVSFSCAYQEGYTEEQQLLGPVLMEKREPAYLAYCARRLAKNEEILKLCADDAKRSSQLRKQSGYYRNILEQ